MKVIGKDRTSCDVCNPIDEILARLDALERRASAIVAKVQGIAPDGEGNVTLPTSSSDTDPLHGRVDAFAMSSEVKEAADDAHAYAASIADDVVVLKSDVENLTREVEALDPASVTALEQSVAALQQTVNRLSNLVGGFSAVIRDLEDQMPTKVERTGDTMAGPLNVIDTVTGSRNAQAVNGNRLQNDLDNYAPMLRTVGNQKKVGVLTQENTYGQSIQQATGYRVSDTTDRTNTFVANRILDADGKYVYSESYGRRADGSKFIRFSVNNLLTDGTYKQSTLIINTYPDGTAGLVLEDGRGKQITIGRTQK